MPPAARPTDFHGKGAEEVGHQAADEETDDDHMVGQIEGHLYAGLLEAVGVVSEEHQGGETCRADGITLGYGLGGVAHGVERVGDVAHALVESGHLGDAAGVVGDGAVGVEGHDDAGHGQHGGCGDGDAVQARQLVGAPDREAHRDDGQAVDFMDTPRPAMTLVPSPVVEASAIWRTGAYSVPV